MATARIGAAFSKGLGFTSATAVSDGTGIAKYAGAVAVAT